MRVEEARAGAVRDYYARPPPAKLDTHPLHKVQGNCGKICRAELNSLFRVCSGKCAILNCALIEDLQPLLDEGRIQWVARSTLHTKAHNPM